MASKIVGGHFVYMEKNMKKTRYITDAAMISAVVAVLLLINNATGQLLVVNFSFLLPVPVTLYGLKYDYKKAFLPAFAIICISLIINWLIGLLYVLPAMLVSVLYTLIINKFQYKIGIKVGCMFIGSLLVNVLTTVIFSKALFGYTIIEDMTNLANNTVDLLTKVGLVNDFFNNSIRAILISIIPAIIAINSLMEAILTYLFISILAQRILKINLGANLLTLNIRVPSIVTFVLMPLALASLFFFNQIVEYDKFGFVQILVTVGLNILVVLCLAYLLEAIVIISFYATKTRKTYLLLLAFLFIIFCPFVLMVIGFIDSVFDLRRKIIFK